MATGIASQVSARNQISGTIAEIHKGAAMSVVTVSAQGHTITSAITNQAVQELGLRPHDAVIALVKATEGMIAKGDAGAMKISARNKVSGRVTHVEKGQAMAAVTVDASNWKLTTAITRQAADDLQLVPGDQVTAFFKSTEVLLQKT
ncbi:MAG TPA: TOBE domain-containing protein [Nitrospira sp.]|jgi:molybdate transport system regulatory protein|nr:TOBE domain-containing protein [Nitrospira sp.]